MKQKEGKRSLFILVVVLIAAAIAALLVFFLKNSIDQALYAERKASLEQLIETSARSIDAHVSTEWEVATVYENDVKAHLQDFDSVGEYLAYLKTQLSDSNDHYFLVDSIGKYYCSDGTNGKISDTTYFLDDQPDRVEYLDTLPHFKDGVTYLILRSRLETPITVTTAKGSISIRYCCLMHNIESLNDRISDLFGGKNNSMIYDTDTGVMLYKQFGIRLLIDGYNVYEKYRKINLLYGSVGTQVIEEVKNKQISVTMMDLEGEKYYLCSSPLNVSNWSVILVVAGEYFNGLSGFAFTRLIYTIAIILGVAALLAIFLFWYFTRLKLNKQLLANQVKTNQALQEAYQTKSNFLSYMSHDIRTPINGVIGMAGIGIANRTDPEKVEECFRKIDLSGKHLLAIVNDVLDMSALESGKVMIQNERMNLPETLSSCMEIIKGSLTNRKLQMLEEYDCPVPVVEGDAFHLKQIIINILSNAVKFTEDGGTIRVSCKLLEETGDRLRYRMAVSDTGIGMTEEFREHIFEAFKQANPGGRSKYKGTGLGMAISHEYVKLMQGTIEVQSKLNEGSTFIIELPFGRMKAEAPERKPEEMNVLLVEDNDINLEIALEMLEGRVKSVQTARDGKEALECFMASPLHSFDLILMDVMMPVMNGLEAAKAIRSGGREDCRLPIIALTANTYKDDIDAIFAAGMDDYLNKPFSAEQLFEKIRKGETPS